MRGEREERVRERGERRVERERERERVRVRERERAPHNTTPDNSVTIVSPATATHLNLCI